MKHSKTKLKKLKLNFFLENIFYLLIATENSSKTFPVSVATIKLQKNEILNFSSEAFECFCNNWISKSCHWVLYGRFFELLLRLQLQRNFLEALNVNLKILEYSRHFGAFVDYEKIFKKKINQLMQERKRTLR